MNNIVENVIATVIVAALSTSVGFILRAFGFSPQESINAALFALLALVILFLVGRNLYPKYKRLLTMLRGTSITEYQNQEACETHIREASRNAKKVKILTIRGEKYFLGAESLLHDLLSSKRMKGSSIEVLVLSPESRHITDELAEEMGQHSAKAIKVKMSGVLEILKDIAEQNRNFEVRCYDETPSFKMLLFDNVMFVSAFTEPKNDHNAKMYRMTREGTPLFTGLERNFDDLWKRSTHPL